MKRSELVKWLNELPDVEIVLQKDSEGNGYSPLCGVELGKYDAESTWSGEFYGLDNLKAELKSDDAWLEQSDVDRMIDAIVLYPIN